MIIPRRTSKTKLRKITMFGLPYFSQHLVKLINSSCSHLQSHFVDIKREKSLLARYFLLARKISSSDLIYQIGGFPRKKIVQLIRILNVPLIIHWVGTDVLAAREHFGKISNHYLCEENIIHWTDAPWLVNELKEIHIQAKFIPLPVSSVKKILSQPPPPFPRKFTILSYLPENRLKSFRSDYIIKLIEDFPEISLKIVANSGKHLKKNFKNVEFLGWISDMNKIYSKSTLLVRMVRHDGYPWTIQESLAMGRYAIWNYPLTGVFEARNYKEMCFYINKLFNLHKEGKLALNEKGRRYIKTQLNPQALIEQVIDNISKIFHQEKVI